MKIIKDTLKILFCNLITAKIKPPLLLLLLGWGKEHQCFYPPDFEHILLTTFRIYLSFIGS